MVSHLPRDSPHRMVAHATAGPSANGDPPLAAIWLAENGRWRPQRRAIMAPHPPRDADVASPAALLRCWWARRPARRFSSTSVCHHWGCGGAWPAGSGRWRRLTATTACQGVVPLGRAQRRAVVCRWLPWRPVSSQRARPSRRVPPPSAAHLVQPHVQPSPTPVWLHPRNLFSCTPSHRH